MKNLNKAMDSGQKTVKIFDLAGISNYKIIDVCFDYREFDYETKQKIEKDIWSVTYFFKAFPQPGFYGFFYVRLQKNIIDLIPIDKGEHSKYCYSKQNDELEINKNNNKIVIFLK